MKKAVVISLSLLILLLACGRLPEDPGRSRKPVLPGMASNSATPAVERESGGLFVPVPSSALRKSPARSL